MKKSGLARGRQPGTKRKENGSREKKSAEPTNEEPTAADQTPSTKGKKKSKLRKKKEGVKEEKSRSKKSTKSKRKKKTKVEPEKPLPIIEQPPPPPPREAPSLKGFTQVALDAMDKYHKDIMRQTGKTVHEEWQSIQGIKVDDLVPAEKMTKSFEPTVACVESTRLKTEGLNFYHASWFTMPESGVKDPRFILAQAPTTQGIEDFWQAMFQAEAGLMFLLTPLYEDGRGCDCFFPVGVGEYKNYGKMMVHNKKEEKFEFGTSYTFEVLPQSCSNAIFIRVVHFEQWEPGKTPVLKGILSMMQTCRYDAESTSPIVCVSRKGTGRPGVLAAAVIIYNRLIQGNYTPLVEVVTNLRKQRADAIDNLAQYCFIGCAIASYIRKRSSPSKWEEARKHIGDCWKEAETL